MKTPTRNPDPGVETPSSVVHSKAKGVKKGGQFSKSLHKDIKSTLDFTIWRQLMKRMVELMAEDILTNTLGFTLPANLGLLSVIKIKSKKGFINHIELCQTGEKKQQYNFHTFGHTYRVDWKQLGNTNFPNRSLYRFKACRSLNRALAQKIFAGQDYLPKIYRNG